MEVAPLDRLVKLSGFGTVQSADGYLYRPGNLDAAREVLRLARQSGRNVVLRGAGRSYGDAAILPESIVLDLTRLNTVIDWNPASGLLVAEGGLTIEGMWRRCLEDGWWPPVVSGTMATTLAGALSMNIHGKNAWIAGPIGEHVREFVLLLADGTLQTLRPEDPAFRIVIGGLGLFGAIVRVAIQMKRVENGMLDVRPVPCRNWSEQFRAFEEAESANYRVSWVDSFAGGKAAGRGLFHTANYSHGVDAASLHPSAQDLPSSAFKNSAWRVLKLFNRRPGMRLVNALKHLGSALPHADRPYRQSLVAFSFLLDYVPNWRRAYEPGGFIQYQSFVPKDVAPEVFAEHLARARSERLEPFLAVLKRHRTDDFLVSHGVDGYSLALDFKVTDRNWADLRSLTDRMTDPVLDSGGRFYFAKDSTLRPADAERFLGPETLTRLREAKHRFDPDGVFTSSLVERLGLLGAPAVEPAMFSGGEALCRTETRT